MSDDIRIRHNLPIKSIREMEMQAIPRPPTTQAPLYYFFRPERPEFQSPGRSDSGGLGFGIGLSGLKNRPQLKVTALTWAMGFRSFRPGKHFH